jgi:hypothetical protein
VQKFKYYHYFDKGFLVKLTRDAGYPVMNISICNDEDEELEDCIDSTDDPDISNFVAGQA